MDNLGITVVFLITLLFCFTLDTKENFTTVGYNGSDLPTYTVDSTYFTQTKHLEDSFNLANRNNAYYDDQDLTLPSPSTSNALTLNDLQNTLRQTGYSLHNKNILFPLSDVFKRILQNYLHTNKIFGENAYISSDILDIYVKDY